MKLFSLILLGVLHAPSYAPDASYEISCVEVNTFGSSSVQCVFWSEMDGELVLRGWCWESDAKITRSRGGYEIQVKGVPQSLWAPRIWRTFTDHDVEVAARPGQPIEWLKR